MFAGSEITLWRPYIDVVTGQVVPRAGLYASAAVCVKATAETKVGVRLFPKGGEPAGTVFVVNFGYGFIYGYSWGLLAELSFPEPANLVQGVFAVSARQLATALDAESATRPEPMRSVLAGAADLVELVLPPLAGLLCSAAGRRAGRGSAGKALSASATTLATQLGQHLLEKLVSAALDGLTALLAGLRPPDRHRHRQLAAHATSRRRGRRRGRPHGPVDPARGDRRDLGRAPRARPAGRSATRTGNSSGTSWSGSGPG